VLCCLGGANSPMRSCIFACLLSTCLGLQTRSLVKPQSIGFTRFKFCQTMKILVRCR
jgi:hypothetical protein